MTEIKSESGGKVLISDDILAVIAGKAATEVEGVTAIGVYTPGNKMLRKNMQKGVSVVVSGQNVKLAMAITVKMGTKLHEISREVQERVKAAVETMTGLNVVEVNVRIGAISTERQKAQ